MYQHYQQFLKKEKDKKIQEFENLCKARALSLYEHEKLYLAQYIKVDHKGMLVVAFPSQKGIPANNEFLWAFILDQKDCNYNKWDNISYRNLFKKAKHYSSVQCIWKQKGDTPNVIIAGFSGLEIDMTPKLSPNCLIVFGPKEPPILYYENLKYFIQKNGIEYSKILNQTIEQNNWDPTIIENDKKKISFLIMQLELEDALMIQGPPGTGKTTLIARLANQLIKNGKSVLISALANKALIEVAIAINSELKDTILSKSVYKTNISEDERQKIPSLLPIKNPEAVDGSIVLSTFYKSSQLFTDEIQKLFDYVIVDEASQAFLGTLAGFKHIGKKNIWIGDQQQLPPVVELNSDEVQRLKVVNFINGFQTVCENDLFPSFMMNKTFRFGQNAADLTSVFYQKKLVAQEQIKKLSLDKLSKTNQQLFNLEGGHSLSLLELKLGSKTPNNLINPLKELLEDTFSNYKYEVLMIAPFRNTVKWLQKELSPFMRPNFTVETIDRIQGKNTDICLFILPNYLYSFTLDIKRFNVATSRAKYHTIIFADNQIKDKIKNEKIAAFFTKISSINYYKTQTKKRS